MPPSTRPNLCDIPQGARSPAIPSSMDAWTPYLQTVNSGGYDDSYRPYAASSTTGLPVPERIHGRAASLTSSRGPTSYFEPGMARSASYASSLIHAKRRPSNASTASTLSRRESMDFMMEVRKLLTMHTMIFLLKHLHKQPETPSQAPTTPITGLVEELSSLT